MKEPSNSEGFFFLFDEKKIFHFFSIQQFHLLLPSEKKHGRVRVLFREVLSHEYYREKVESRL